MCRYAYSGPYKEKFACFHCRKVFKQTNRRELTYAMPIDARGKRRAICPECKSPMHDMGLDFHAPRQADKKQWRKVALLFAGGFAYHSCGCGPGYRPSTLAELPAFLAAEAKQPQSGEKQRVKQLKTDRRKS